MTISLPLEAAAAIAVPVVTFVVWLLRLEGRINVHESEIGNVRDDIKYIRSRIDEAIDQRAGV